MTLIILSVFICVAALVGAVLMLLASRSSSDVEERLEQLTSGGSGSSGRDSKEKMQLLARDLDEARGITEDLLRQFIDLRRFLDQGDVRLSPAQFMLIVIGLAGMGGMTCYVVRLPWFVGPIVGALLATLPFLFVYIKRKRRTAAFTKQLPDALELISRALRSGHSLASGINLVGDEMSDPICTEFSRCYEEQNLGIPLEEALEGMTQRVPNMDLRFFATAVVLQRTTGGDLAEILDKIGSLIRERFKIWGQIQALTGEGRLSGIVLLALPPVLFVVMYRLNPDYVMRLFTDPIGQWMLGGAVALQLVGAVVIKKIVDIKV